MTVDEALDVTIANGGGTFNARTFAPIENGPWAVGGKLPGVKLDAGGSPTYLRVQLQRAFVDLAWAGAETVGTWVDDGTLYVDAVDLIEDTDEAIALAAERGELAIYHLTSKVTLEVSRS